MGFDGQGLPAYVGADAAPLHLGHLRADVDLRYPLDALLGECAVVNAKEGGLKSEVQHPWVQ